MTSTLIPASGPGTAATQDFAYDPTQTVPTVLSDGDFAFVYGPGGTPIEQLPLATGTTASAPALITATNTGTPATGTTTLLTDAHGSVRALVGTSGTVPTVEAALTYDAYGHASSLSGLSLSSLAQPGSPLGDTPGGPSSALTPLGYTGAYTDSQTGLEYLVHRYYDPSTGTFLSVDPLVGLTGDPYGYVGGNPTNAVDPLGLFCWGLCTFTNAAHYAAKHKVEIGVALGAIALAATGVGLVADFAIAGVAIGAGTELALDLTAVSAGTAAWMLDQQACRDQGNVAACVGMAMGGASVLAGGAGLGYGLSSVEGTDSIATGFNMLSFGFGAVGEAGDIVGWGLSKC